MLERVRRSVVESSAAFADVFANPSIRRLQLAWSTSILGGTAYVVALLVYAFEQDGAYAVGLLGLVRWLASGLFSPVGGIIADRYPRVRVMVVSDLIRVVLTLAMAAVVIVEGPPFVVYALAILVSLSATPFRPAEAALLPSLARAPQELTAANVTASTIESAGWFVGPALGGLLLAATGVSTSFVVIAVVFLVSALFVGGIREPRASPRGAPRRPAAAAEDDVETEEEHGMLAGFRVLARDGDLRAIVGLVTAQTFLDGALSVLIVVLALDTLDLGEAGVGYLNSASGIGGLVGAAAVGALVARGRLASDFALGVLLWGLPLIALGLWVEPAFALVALAFVGAANTLVDVSGDTILQRAVPEEVLARVFGVLEALALTSVALGSGVAPLAVDLVGIEATLIAAGALLPVLAAVSWRRLRSIDVLAAVPARELELLQRLPMFAPLPPPTLEYLAGRLRPRRVPAGQTIFSEGEAGDDFYVISDGSVQVSIDGRPTRELAEGDYFGEIALLRAVPRTATVAATSDAELYALDGDAFVAAVTGHAASAAAADTVVAARIGTARPVRV